MNINNYYLPVDIIYYILNYINETDGKKIIKLTHICKLFRKYYNEADDKYKINVNIASNYNIYRNLYVNRIHIPKIFINDDYLDINISGCKNLYITENTEIYDTEIIGPAIYYDNSIANKIGCLIEKFSPEIVEIFEFPIFIPYLYTIFDYYKKWVKKYIIHTSTSFNGLLDKSSKRVKKWKLDNKFNMYTILLDNEALDEIMYPAYNYLNKIL